MTLLSSQLEIGSVASLVPLAASPAAELPYTLFVLCLFLVVLLVRWRA